MDEKDIEISDPVMWIAFIGGITVGIWVIAYTWHELPDSAGAWWLVPMMVTSVVAEVAFAFLGCMVGAAICHLTRNPKGSSTERKD